MRRKAITRMKARTVRLLAGEGLANVYKNKWMSLASIVMVNISLMILGLVLLLAVNLGSNLDTARRELEIIVFMEVEATPFELTDMEQWLQTQQDADIVSVWRHETKEEAFALYSEDMKNVNQEIMTAEYMPDSYYAKLTDPESSTAFLEELAKLDGISPDGIAYPREILDKLDGVVGIANMITIAVLVLMIIVSVFIISNTIRLTVYARRREIGIMKYVGAKDWFIRLPFIVEGLAIGLLGGLLSYILTAQMYGFIQRMVNAALVSNNLSIFQLVGFAMVSARFFAVFVLFGMSIGAAGSLISVRKHLNV